MKTIQAQILRFAQKHPLFRATDIPGTRKPRTELSRMVESGELIRTGRGLYSLPNTDFSEHHALTEAVRLYHGGVVCLISALYFHKIGTQLPYETWLMRKDRNVAPQKEYPVRFVYCTGDAYYHGIETHIIEGTKIEIYSLAKTIADCFKYRNKIGLDVAIEALREGWKVKAFTMDELWTALKICRVQKIAQPYLEMVVQCIGIRSKVGDPKQPRNG